MTDNMILSPVHQRVLHKQTIGEHEPGAVLQDFVSLLDFVGSREIVVSGKHQLLPMSLLAELNSRLMRTIDNLSHSFRALSQPQEALRVALQSNRRAVQL